MQMTKGFAPTSPVTPEENDNEIERLEAQIDAASKKRDYLRADQLQSRLDYCLQVRQFFAKQKRAANKRAELERLANAQRQEEKQIKQKMERKMRALLEEADRRYQQIEQRHKDEIERLDTKFSDPRLFALRMSSNVKTLLRMEKYYAKQKNYKLANAIKNQITERTQTEMAMTDLNANQAVDAAIESCERRFEQEKRGFHARLEDDKFKLNHEAAREILKLHNKYMNLRHRLLDIGEENKPNDDEGKMVFSAIESGFGEYMSTTGYTPSPPAASQSPKRTATRSSYNSMRNTARNPRVVRALEKSMLRRDKLAMTL